MSSFIFDIPFGVAAIYTTSPIEQESVIYNIILIQTEWSEINTAKHQWEIQRATQLREVERGKSDANRKIEEANKREMEAEKILMETQRRIQDDLDRFSIEAGEFNSLRADIDGQRTTVLSQQQYLQQENNLVQERMREIVFYFAILILYLVSIC